MPAKHRTGYGQPEDPHPEVAMRVLVVEDENLLAGYVAEGLRDQATSVDVAHDGSTALVTRDGRPVPLSNKEFGVLAALMAANGTKLDEPPIIDTLPGVGYRIAGPAC
jgi:DNA-binding response OmpR family regulator